MSIIARIVDLVRSMGHGDPSLGHGDCKSLEVSGVKVGTDIALLLTGDKGLKPSLNRNRAAIPSLQQLGQKEFLS